MALQFASLSSIAPTSATLEVNHDLMAREILSDITVFMKYAKFREDLGRRETWAELTDRNVAMHVAKYPELETEIRTVYTDFVKTKKVLPSMRSLQFAGPAIEKNPTRIYNCFRQSTRFVTRGGVKSFEDFSDGDTTVVQTHTGQWKPAVVRCYGEQPLNKITINRGVNRTTEYATAEHRWLLVDGSETVALKKGDKLMAAPNTFTPSATPPAESFYVSDIQPFAIEPVWCLEVEDDHSFVLASGISTGNCSYAPIDHIDGFSETIFLLLGGTGVGVSVQKHHIEQLPPLVGTTQLQGKERPRRYLVGDSIEGWADAVKVLIESWFKGKKPVEFDYRDIRQKGERLITAGGKAPGPGPLRECITQVTNVLERAVADRGRGTHLLPIEAHDIICHLADAVLAGGIRRAALISLFSFDDDQMLTCKFGSWWEMNPQRGRANNSVVLDRSKIVKQDFLDLWKKVEASNAGEPGFYFTNDPDWGTNPCCFVAETTIETSHGSKAIWQIVEDVNRGKEVLVPTINEATHQHELKKVVAGSLTRKEAEVVTLKILLEDGKTFKKITCTPDHKILTKNRGWVEAKDLTKDDDIVERLLLN